LPDLTKENAKSGQFSGSYILAIIGMDIAFEEVITVIERKADRYSSLNKFFKRTERPCSGKSFNLTKLIRSVPIGLFSLQRENIMS
jgi:hypothetical protein